MRKTVWGYAVPPGVTILDLNAEYRAISFVLGELTRLAGYAMCEWK